MTSLDCIPLIIRYTTVQFYIRYCIHEEIVFPRMFKVYISLFIKKRIPNYCSRIIHRKSKVNNYIFLIMLKFYTFAIPRFICDQIAIKTGSVWNPLLLIFFQSFYTFVFYSIHNFIRYSSNVLIKFFNTLRTDNFVKSKMEKKNKLASFLNSRQSSRSLIDYLTHI